MKKDTTSRGWERIHAATPVIDCSKSVAPSSQRCGTCKGRTGPGRVRPGTVGHAQRHFGSTVASPNCSRLGFGGGPISRHGDHAAVGLLAVPGVEEQDAHARLQRSDQAGRLFGEYQPGWSAADMALWAAGRRPRCSGACEIDVAVASWSAPARGWVCDPVSRRRAAWAGGEPGCCSEYHGAAGAHSGDEPPPVRNRLGVLLGRDALVRQFGDLGHTRQHDEQSRQPRQDLQRDQRPR